jgi:hypothetical protein
LELPEDVSEFVEQLDATRRSVVEGFIEVLLKAEPRFEVAMKWKRPTFTLNGNWHHWVCAIQPAIGRVSLEFHKGVLLDDPHGVLIGDGKYLRRNTATDVDQIDRAALTELVRDATAKQTDM